MFNQSMRLAYALFIIWGTFTQAWSQEDLILDVDANCGPWIFKEGGLNGGYPYGRGDHLPPVVVKADGQFPFRKGELIQIQYLSKRARSVAWNNDNSCDSEGETIRLVNDFKGYTGKYMPSRYISSIEYPVFLMSLIGVFTDENGSIIGSPFKVGLNRIVQVPDGAKQIQFGINDDWFQTPPPNLGSYQIILKRLPQPNLVAPQQSDQEVDALLGEGGIGVTTHQMLGDCRIQSITPGGSAEREGRLKKDDVILAVIDNSNNWIDVEEMKLPVIRRLLRGDVGSEVHLRIMRPADPRMGVFDVKLRREKLSGVKSSSNERQKSIRLDWKKETGSSLWEAEVNSFDVPSGAAVEVKGPKDGLIRVTGDQPTSIFGAITSSNPVYVINQKGVVVGPGATINDDTFNLIRTKNAQENLKQTKPVLWDLESNARAGDADAQYNLGKYYASRNLHKFGYSGWPNPEKQDEAFMWFKRSAEQGNAKGQYGVGQCYMTGIGVTKNQQKALHWFMKSAMQGYDEAQYALGTCYVSGVGSAFDYKEGFKWYMRAADQGYACAQNALGCYYIEGKMGSPKDEKKAVNYFTKSAEGGCQNGLKHLAICYHEGIGVTKDEKAVTKWRTKASFLKEITCCSIFWPKGDDVKIRHLTFTPQSGNAANYDLLTDWDEYLATRSGASLKDVDIKKGKKDMKRVFELGPGVRPPDVTVTSYTTPIDVSYGKNALSDYLWLGDIRLGGLSEIKEEQGSFGRNGTTIFPNNPQSSTNP